MRYIRRRCAARRAQQVAGRMRLSDATVCIFRRRYLCAVGHVARGDSDRFLQSDLAAARVHQRDGIQLEPHGAGRSPRATVTGISRWACDRWHLAMPWFEMIRLPAAFVGGELCWRGEIMWEGADEPLFAVARSRLPCDRGCRRGAARVRHRHQAGYARHAACAAVARAPAAGRVSLSCRIRRSPPLC